MWDRLAVQATLLDDRTDSNRDAKCQRTRYTKDAAVSLRRNGQGGWSLGGVIACGRMTCACCGVRRARYAASVIGALMERHLGVRGSAVNGSDVWMLTLSPPHAAGDGVACTVDRLYTAAAIFFRTPAWRRFVDAHDICARVRVFDATHGGANGSHPHFHIALFPRAAYLEADWVAPPPATLRRDDASRVRRDCDDELADALVAAILAWDTRVTQPSRTKIWDYVTPLRARSKADRAAYLAELARERLVEAWRQACLQAGIAVPNRQAFARHALTLSPSEDAAAYFTKWGLADEIASSPQKHRSHLRLLDLAAAGGADGDRAADIYRAFREAVDGRAWVTGLGDAMKVIGVHDEDAAFYLAELQRKREKLLADAGTPVPDLLPLELEIRPYLYPAALNLGWPAVFAFCDAHAEAAESVHHVQLALDLMLWRALGSASQQAPPVPRWGSSA